MSKQSPKNIHASGKRKRAVARVTVAPVMLAGETAQKLDFQVRVSGGGPTGQSDAIRLAIGRVLIQHDASLRQKLLDYDRQLVVADIRRKESAKPNSHGQARSKVQKSYR